MEEKELKIIENMLKSVEEYLKPLDEEAPIWMSDFQKNIMENHMAIKNLYKAYKQDKKVINEMAKCIYEDDGSWNAYNKFNESEIIDYFRKKCE